MLGLSFVELEPVQRRWLSGLILLVLALEYLIGRQNTLELTPDALRRTQRGWLTGKRVLDVPSVSLRRVHYQRAAHWWQRDKIVLERQDKTNVRLNVTDWHTADNGDTLAGALLQHPAFTRYIEPVEWQGLPRDNQKAIQQRIDEMPYLIAVMMSLLLFTTGLAFDQHTTLVWGWYWPCAVAVAALTSWRVHRPLKAKLRHLSAPMVPILAALVALAAVALLQPLLSVTSQTRTVQMTLVQSDAEGDFWQMDSHAHQVGCAHRKQHRVGTQKRVKLYVHPWVGTQRVDRRALCAATDGSG